MLKKITEKKAISLLFSIIVTTALVVTSVSLNEVIIRNVQRVSDVQSTMQAQSAANSAFETALVAISSACSDAGCNLNAGQGTAIPIEVDGNVVGSYEYVVEGEAEVGYGGNYYVPIPGEGDAAGENDECEFPESDVNANCNWNKIQYGQTIEIPLYTGDGIDEFDGNLFQLKIRTPECDGTEQNNYYCSGNPERKLISCTGDEDDNIPSTTQNACQLANDPVVLTWQIWGDRAVGSSYIEGKEITGGFGGKRHTTQDSEIYTTFINSKIISDFIVLDLSNETAPAAAAQTIEDALGEFAYPVLKLSLVENVYNGEDSISHLEYQVVTDVPISNNTSVITVTGYVESGGETYRWEKEGSWTSFTSSPINFAFQN